MMRMLVNLLFKEGNILQLVRKFSAFFVGFGVFCYPQRKFFSFEGVGELISGFHGM